VDYRVHLDVYDGPLDLLLYLIRRDELDIHDIPIARITDSYLTYVHALKQQASLDINTAGEFVVMAATLMEIKSAMLLPRHDPEKDGANPDSVSGGGSGGGSAAAELTDPRADLVRQLLEYKRFKDTARLLERRGDDHAQRFARTPVWAGESADEPPPLDLEEVQIWDLLSAFSKLMSEIGGDGLRKRSGQHEVVDDDTPLDLHAADIEDRLKREKKLTLRDLLVGRASRSEMVGVFLALLELVRQRRLALGVSETPDQDTAPATGLEILILPAPPLSRPAPPQTPPSSPSATGEATTPSDTHPENTPP
jgi:segregation and condensation protein A